MMADTTRIRSALEGLEDLPTPVQSWVVEDGLDATDDPAVWVWAVVETEPDAFDPDSMSQLKSMARDVVWKVTDGRLWPYVLIRGADEAEVAS